MTQQKADEKSTTKPLDNVGKNVTVATIKAMIATATKHGYDVEDLDAPQIRTTNALTLTIYGIKWADIVGDENDND